MTSDLRSPSDAAPLALVETVAAQSARPVPTALSVLVDALRERFGENMAAMIFYGSCLRSDDPTDGLVDVYALVGDYWRAYRQRHLRWLNAWLPPNVFYLERPFGTATLRTKYTVFSLADFERGASRWFHSYLWGRFAQPVRLVYARDETARDRVHHALAAAVITFLERTVPCLDSPFTVETLWREGLRLSYGAELRAERPDRPAQLVESQIEDLRQRTRAALPVLGAIMEPASGTHAYRCRLAERERRRARRDWRLRRWQGRVLSVLRLARNSFTFQGGVDYVAWKIERHTGVHIEVTPRLRKYPLIFGWGVLWRLLRRGVLR